MTISPPRWTLAELATDAETAVEEFRTSRETEPLELYLELFASALGHVEEVLELTVDLSEVTTNAAALLSLDSYRDVVRYLVGPPISMDDLRNLIGKDVYLPASRGNQIAAKQILESLWANLDRMRFPWPAEGREPTELERHAAVIATTALLAQQKTATARRTGAKILQETRVKNALSDIGFTEVPARVISNPSRAPKPGEFCGESSLVGKKADVVVGLWDERVLAIECKTSNSEVNSYKRVNHEAGGKATHWTVEFGQALIVPAVTIAGVFSPQNLFDAQKAGLTIFWSHSLDRMTDWIEQTRP